MTPNSAGGRHSDKPSSGKREVHPAMRSKVDAELNRLLREGPFGKTRQGQAAWWERMAELFDVRGIELSAAGFPSLGQEMSSVAEYHREQAKGLRSSRDG